MSREAIVIHTEVPLSVERVWELWTDNRSLVAWLSVAANVDAKVGGTYELFWDPDDPSRNSTLGCKIIVFNINEDLSFTWKGPLEYANLMNTEPLPTLVTLHFTSLAPRQTLIRLEHSGWGEGPQWDEARAWHENIWKSALASLQQVTAN